LRLHYRQLAAARFCRAGLLRARFEQDERVETRGAAAPLDAVVSPLSGSENRHWLEARCLTLRGGTGHPSHDIGSHRGNDRLLVGAERLGGARDQLPCAAGGARIGGNDFAPPHVWPHLSYAYLFKLTYINMLGIASKLMFCNL